MATITAPVERPAPPRHPFEVTIHVGGDTWDYVRLAMRELAEHIGEREPDHCNMAAGGAGGSHSLSVFIRDVTPEQFHQELAAWSEGERTAAKLSESAEGGE